MRKFKMTLEYEGTHFSGWQTQSLGLRTIQTHIEEKLERIFKCKVHCQPSGRTDSGVHALAQVAHFKVDTHLSPELIHKALNSFLDRDVSVLKIEEVDLKFNAQMDAREKTYTYTILNRTYPSALWRDRAYLYTHPLNLARMRKAASMLKGKHDFRVFQASSERLNRLNTVRTVKELKVVRNGDFITITITADGFLYKMVRNIVGTLLAIGSGRFDPQHINTLLKARDRKLAPRTAPSHGLCLVSVKY